MQRINATSFISLKNLKIKNLYFDNNIIIRGGEEVRIMIIMYDIGRWREGPKIPKS